MIDSWIERKQGKMKQLAPHEIRAIYRWLKEEDQKLFVYERVVEWQEGNRPVRGLRKTPSASV